MRPEGLYVLKSWYAFASKEDQEGVTPGNDYFINKDGMFIDDNHNKRDADDGSWVKKKGYAYKPEPEHLILKPIQMDKATADDFADAEANGVPTPKLTAIYDDEEVVSSDEYNRALQIVAARASSNTHVHQAPDAEVEDILAEPGFSFVDDCGDPCDMHAGSFHENPIPYAEPEPVDSHALEDPATNPKKARGDAKAPYVFCPEIAVVFMQAVMAGGAHKYGPYNFRESEIDAQTYVGAIKRHLALWADGEELDDESEVTHLAHVMACCAILIDAQSTDMLVDNRNKTGLIKGALQKSAAAFKAFQLKVKSYG